MPVLLHLDSSPLGSASISRHLSSQFVESWKQANPGGTVITRDLTASNLTPVDAAWIGASFTPEDALTPSQRQLLAPSDALIAELQSADEFVIGVPMHNFAVPSVLKLWIDQIVRAGKTFSYGANGPVGLLTGKKATFVVASGGIYDAGTAMASYNFVEPYLRTVFGFIGVTDTAFFTAGGASAVNHGQIDRTAFLAPHVAAIHAALQTA